VTGGIAVVGATGATGRRVAQALHRAGRRLVLVGRNPEALAAVATGLDGRNRAARAADGAGLAGVDVEIRTIDFDRPGSIAAALDGVGAVVNCAGPFGHVGLAVAEAAVRCGVHYVDTSGEPVFALRLVERLDRPARHAGVALVPAVGSSALTGDVAAALALRAASDGATALTLAYRIRGMRASRGTVLSEIEITAGGAVVVEHGVLRRVPAGGPPTLLPAGWGTRMPVPDPVIVSRYCDLPSIEAYLVTPAAGLVGRAMRPGERLLRHPDRRAALRRAASRLPETDDGQPHGEFAVQATVWGRDGAHTMSAGASDVYGFTARSAAYVAAMLADGGGAAGGGVRAATQVLADAGDRAVPDALAVEKAGGELGIALASSLIAAGEPLV
jgi:hypothetical protein